MNMKRLIVLLSCVSVMSLLQAEVYRYQDDKGRWHFTDKPRESDQSEVVELEPLNGMSPVTIPEGFFRDTKEAVRSVGLPRLTNRQVVMYSTPSCGYCVKAKRFFNTEYVAFSERDISSSDRYRRQFKKLGGQGVPLILVGTRSGMKKVYGFNQSKLVKLLDL